VLFKKTLGEVSVIFPKSIPHVDSRSSAPLNTQLYSASFLYDVIPKLASTFITQFTPFEQACKPIFKMNPTARM